jgi:hypothetical protein
MHATILRGSALILLGLSSLGSSCQPAPFALGPALCFDVAGAPPDYSPADLTPAGAGAVRPLQKVELTGPDSLCNDGSPAVAYVRPAPSNSPNADKWIVLLQGGSSCADANDCLSRFCTLETDPEVWDKAGRMSSLGTPGAIEIRAGLLADAPANDFGDWNHVLGYYCTSDLWSGSAPEKLETAAGPWDPEIPLPATSSWEYEIQFRGEDVVNDLFDTLRGTKGVVVPESGDLEYAMPDLDDASLLLFAGGSAGSNGVRHHLDRIAAELAPSGVEVLGVLDAALSPGYYDPAYSWANAPFASYDDLGANFMVPRFRELWETDDSALDASCLASIAATGQGEWYCMDTIYTLLHEIETPTFVRSDLTDPLGLDTYVGWGLLASGYDVAVATAALFPTLPADFGWFGDHCNVHVKLESPGFARTTIRAGSGLTFHDQLSNWVDGVGLATEVQADNTPGVPPYPLSVDCR